MLGLARKYQERAFRACVFDRSTQQSVEQLFQDHLARNCLRYGDHSIKVAVLHRRGDRDSASRSRGFLFSLQVWLALIDDLLQQRSNIEVNARRSDLPPR